MIDASETTSTRPYLIRALYEWCTDNGLTPYVAVSVNDSVQVPREYVKDGEIVLNISFDATSSLVLGNDYIEFKGRFAGTAREILVPVNQVIAIYAKENGQGMAFPLGVPTGEKSTARGATKSVPALREVGPLSGDVKLSPLTSVSSLPRVKESNEEPEPPKATPIGVRPSLTRVK